MFNHITFLSIDIGLNIDKQIKNLKMFKNLIKVELVNTDSDPIKNKNIFKLLDYLKQSYDNIQIDIHTNVIGDELLNFKDYRIFLSIDYDTYLKKSTIFKASLYDDIIFEIAYTSDDEAYNIVESNIKHKFILIFSKLLDDKNKGYSKTYELRNKLISSSTNLKIEPFCLDNNYMCLYKDSIIPCIDLYDKGMKFESENVNKFQDRHNNEVCRYYCNSYIYLFEKKLKVFYDNC